MESKEEINRFMELKAFYGDLELSNQNMNIVDPSRISILELPRSSRVKNTISKDFSSFKGEDILQEEDDLSNTFPFNLTEKLIKKISSIKITKAGTISFIEKAANLFK